MSSPLVYLATCSQLPGGDPDTRLLADHLRAHSLSVEVLAWDDPDVEWSDAALTLIRSTWDYHKKLEDFIRWARSVPALYNPAPLVEWNTDKRYLLELPANVPVIPSRSLTDPSPALVTESLAELGAEVGVIKPVVGLDGHGVTRVSAGEPGEGPRSGTWLLQPMVEAAATEGEVSVVVIDGEPTHAVRRRPPENDFRAQERLGGSVAPVQPDPATEALALRAIEGLDPVPLYARVDLVRVGGRPTLLELELVEPSLFFEHGARGLEAMTRAVASRL